MVKLIEFLMNNIFIVVIIVGALFSLLGKASGSKNRPAHQQGTSTSASQRTPAMEERRQESGYEREPAPTVYRSVQSMNEQSNERAEADRAEQLRRLAAERDTLERMTLERTLRQAPVQKGRAAVTSAGAHVDGMKPASSVVSSEDLRRAVIWAEVLGPPRAKRHYRK